MNTATGDEAGAGGGGPDGVGLVERVAGMRGVLREEAARGERERRVSEVSMRVLREAGLLRIAQPRRYGGYETSMRTMLDVSAAIGEADGGTAWTVTLLNVCAWMVGLFPQRAQDDVWARDPDALVSGVLTPTAESRRVAGGRVVSGRWFYSSGAWHASWALLGIPATTDGDGDGDDGGGEVVDQGLALIPREDLELEETWFVAGMRSTGSNCLIAREVFVPDHRIVSMPSAIEGDYATEHTEETLYRSAFVPVLVLVLAGPQLGMGRAALEIVREKAARKPISYTFYTAQSDSVGFQLQLAEAAMLIDTAHLHAYRAAADIDEAAARGEYPSRLVRARVRADTGWAVDHIVKAIDLLLSAHGAASFAEANPLQRIWRDSAVAARHAVVVPVVGYEVYGKALLGREDQMTPLV